MRVCRQAGRQAESATAKKDSAFQLEKLRNGKRRPAAVAVRGQGGARTAELEESKSSELVGGGKGRQSKRRNETGVRTAGERCM